MGKVKKAILRELFQILTQPVFIISLLVILIAFVLALLARVVPDPSPTMNISCSAILGCP